MGRRMIVLVDVLRESSVPISKNLKRLSLNSLKVSGEALGLFLRNCPLLEQLNIENSLLTSDHLEVCGGVLKHLIIKKDCSGGKSIKVYAPNLTMLKIDSRLRLSYIKASKLLSSIPFPQLTTLQLTLHRPKDFLKKGFPRMPKLRVLTVAYSGQRSIHIRTINSLLCALSCLEQLTVKYYYCRNRIQEEHGVKDNVNFERFHHPHLRVFNFQGWLNVCKHRELMSYILDDCVALWMIIIHVHEPTTPTRFFYLSSNKVARENARKFVQSKLPAHIDLLVV